MSDLEKASFKIKGSVVPNLYYHRTYIVKIFDFRGAVYLGLEMRSQFQYPGSVFQSGELSRVGSISVFIRVFPITKTVDRVSLDNRQKK